MRIRKGMFLDFHIHNVEGNDHKPWSLSVLVMGRSPKDCLFKMCKNTCSREIWQCLVIDPKNSGKTAFEIKNFYKCDLTNNKVRIIKEADENANNQDGNREESEKL